MGKDIFEEMYQTGESPEAVIAKKGLKQITDDSEIEKVCQEVLTQNAKIVEDFKNGKQQALGALVGKVMQATKGQANPGKVNEMLTKLLK